MGSSCARSTADSSTEVNPNKPPTCTVALLCSDDDEFDGARDPGFDIKATADRDVVYPEPYKYADADADADVTKSLSRPLLRDNAFVTSPQVSKFALKAPHRARANASQSDLDFCFQFVLPGRAKKIAAKAKLETRPDVAAELRNAAEADRIAMSKEGAAFVAYLEAKAKRTGAWDKHLLAQDSESIFQSLVEKLFKEFFVEDSAGSQFKCPQIASLADARKLCVDLLFTFLRREVESYYSNMFLTLDHEQILLCVKMDQDLAEIHADVSEYTLLLDKAALHAHRLNIGLAHGLEGEHGAAMQPAHAIFRKAAKDLFKLHEEIHDPDVKSVIRNIDSIRLLYDRITDVFDIEAMKQCGLLVDYFPLHNEAALRHLRNKWAIVGRWYRYDQPIEDIRQYFGENIAMYFIFVEFVCRWTRWLALAGVVTVAVDLWIDGTIEMDRAGILRVLGAKHGVPMARFGIAFFTIMWSMLFRIYLGRKAWRYYSMWGMDCDFNTSQIKAESNPRFTKMAHMVKSQVDDNVEELGVTPQERYWGGLLSVMGSFFFVASAFTSVLGLMKIQATLSAAGRDSLLTQAAPYTVIIPIKVFNLLSCLVAPVLTDYEHHRDRLDYENSIAYKKFYLQILNTFCTFYYIAFLMRPWGDTTYVSYGGPWEYLTFEMLVTFLSYIACVVLDIVTPMVNMYFALARDLKKAKKLGELPVDAKATEIPFLDLQRRMDSYTGDVRNEDHIQILLPLGFVILFGATLPLGACLALCVFGLQLRVDALKLTTAMRRPFPASVVPGQWIWLDLVKHLMWVSVVTNLALVCFTMGSCRNWELVDQVVLFFALGSMVLLVDQVLSCFIPEMPHEVRLAQQRHRHQRHAYAAFVSEKEALKRPNVNDLTDVFANLKNCGVDYSNVPGCDVYAKGIDFPDMKLRRPKV